MDLDEMMGRIYSPANDTRERRLDWALDCYIDVLNQYGDNSVEEKKVYAVLGEIFPEMNGLCDESKELKAALIRGELK